MLRNLKNFVLVLAAAFAVSAAMASVAAAVTQKFEIGTGEGKIQGTQSEGEPVRLSFGVGVLTVTCKVAIFEAEILTTSSTVEGVSNVSDCRWTRPSGEGPATIYFNECRHLFHVGETVALDRYSASGDLVCPWSRDIEVFLYATGTPPTEHNAKNEVCAYTIKPQNSITTIELENTTTATPKKDILVVLKMSNIFYTKTVDKGVILCGAAEGKSNLKGQATVRGLNFWNEPLDAVIVEV